MHDYDAPLLAAGAVTSPTPGGKHTQKNKRMKMGKSVLQLGKCVRQMCVPENKKSA